MDNLKDAIRKHEKTFILFSIASLLWLHRSLFKPSRYNYPCQKAARAQSFLFFSLYALPIATRIKNKSLNAIEYVKSKSLVKDVLIILTIFFVIFSVFGIYEIIQQKAYEETFRKRFPLGLTLNPQSDLNHRVVRIHSNSATNWDFSTLAICEPTNVCYWQHVDQTTVNQMVEDGVKSFTGAATSQQAWQTILSGYVPGDIVGIKINGNDFEPFYHSEPNYINTIPQVINAVINGIKNLGVPESDIWVIEPTGSGGREFYSYYFTIINGLYPDVQLLDRDDITFGNNPELQVTFPYGSPLYITDQMAEIDHLIIMPIMKAITPDWGLTGTIKMMQGNIQQQDNLHGYLTRTTDNPNVLIYQNQHIGGIDGQSGKVKLIVGDGLFGAWTGKHFGEGNYGGQDQLGEPINDTPRRWVTFNNDAPNLLFFALDPVAIDSIMYDHVLRERNAQGALGYDLAPFNEPQLISGANNNLGVHETHKNPDDPSSYISIDYVLIELGGTITTTSTTTPTITSTTIPIIPSTWRTCSDTWGSDCGNMPDIDNTFDNCPTSTSLHSDNHVDEVYLSYSNANTGQTLTVICEFDPYGTVSGEYVWYYNSSNWKRLYAGNSPGNTIHNVTINFVVDNIIGQHWIRCVTDGDGTGTTSCESGSWFDHDDVNFTVTCTGDTDRDNDVDMIDVVTVINAYGSKPGDPNWSPNADFNRDNEIKMDDIITVINNFDRQC